VDFDTGKLCLTFVSRCLAAHSAVVGGDIFIDALVKTVLSISCAAKAMPFWWTRAATSLPTIISS
jgi:methyl-accepting chemotaxis protein